MHHHSVITTATADDLPEILTLQKRCYQENALRYNNPDIPPLRQSFEEIKAEFDRSTFLKATADGKIIGSIRGFCSEGSCFICRLFVHPDFQNRGTGRKLLHAIEHHFSGILRFELFTGHKDDKNIALYTKMGYRKFKEELRNNDGMLFFFMEKIIG